MFINIYTFLFVCFSHSVAKTVAFQIYSTFSAAVGNLGFALRTTVNSVMSTTHLKKIKCFNVDNHIFEDLGPGAV